MTKRIIALALCLTLVGALLISCAAHSPKDLVKKMQNALNKKDGKAVLELIEPESREEMKKSAEMMGMREEELADMIVESVKGKITLKCGEISYNNKKTEAQVRITAEIEGEEDLSSSVTCVKVKGKWYMKPNF